jgi:hypothetical protein
MTEMERIEQKKRLPARQENLAVKNRAILI